MHKFVKANTAAVTIIANVPVFDDVERSDQSSCDTCLFANFAYGRELGSLSVVNNALGELPAILGSDAH